MGAGGVRYRGGDGQVGGKGTKDRGEADLRITGPRRRREKPFRFGSAPKKAFETGWPQKVIRKSADKTNGNSTRTRKAGRGGAAFSGRGFHGVD